MGGTSVCHACCCVSCFRSTGLLSHPCQGRSSCVCAGFKGNTPPHSYWLPALLLPVTRGQWQENSLPAVPEYLQVSSEKKAGYVINTLAGYCPPPVFPLNLLVPMVINDLTQGQRPPPLPLWVTHAFSRRPFQGFRLTHPTNGPKVRVTLCSAVQTAQNLPKA